MAFFSGLGASLFFGLGGTGAISAATASVIGTAAVASMAGAAGAGISAAGKAIGKMTEIPQGSPLTPQSIKETAAETIAKSQQIAQTATAARQKAARRSRSIFASPLGLPGEASTVRKTLLGH